MFDLTLLAVSNNFKGELPALRPITIISLITCPLSLIFFFNFAFFLRKMPIPLPFFEEPTATFNQIKHDSVLVLVIDSEDWILRGIDLSFISFVVVLYIK